MHKSVYSIATEINCCLLDWHLDSHQYKTPLSRCNQEIYTIKYIVRTFFSTFVRESTELENAGIFAKHSCNVLKAALYYIFVYIHLDALSKEYEILFYRNHSSFTNKF